MTPLDALLFGLVVLVVLVSRQITEVKKGKARLNLKPFKVPNLTVLMDVVVMAMTMMLGTVLVLLVYLQVFLGVSALVTVPRSWPPPFPSARKRQQPVEPTQRQPRLPVPRKPASSARSSR